MRGARLAVAGLIAAGASLAGTGIAVAQTASTTTVPPVRSIPVTGGTTATTTAPSTGTSDDGDLASTGVAADLLVPFGFALIGVGGVLQVASRRPRRDLGLL